MIDCPWARLHLIGWLCVPQVHRQHVSPAPRLSLLLPLREHVEQWRSLQHEPGYVHTHTHRRGIQNSLFPVVNLSLCLTGGMPAVYDVSTGIGGGGSTVSHNNLIPLGMLCVCDWPIPTLLTVLYSPSIHIWISKPVPLLFKSSSLLIRDWLMSWIIR